MKIKLFIHLQGPSFPRLILLRFHLTGTDSQVAGFIDIGNHQFKLFPTFYLLFNPTMNPFFHLLKFTQLSKLYHPNLFSNI